MTKLIVNAGDGPILSEFSDCLLRHDVRRCKKLLGDSHPGECAQAFRWILVSIDILIETVPSVIRKEIDLLLANFLLILQPFHLFFYLKHLVDYSHRWHCMRRMWVLQEWNDLWEMGTSQIWLIVLVLIRVVANGTKKIKRKKKVLMNWYILLTNQAESL